MSTTKARTIKALGIAGSLREGSYDRALLRAARDLAPDDLEIETFDNEILKGIPRAMPGTLLARMRVARAYMEAQIDTADFEHRSRGPAQKG